jgi:hypothetical protein
VKTRDDLCAVCREDLGDVYPCSPGTLGDCHPDCCPDRDEHVAAVVWR